MKILKLIAFLFVVVTFAACSKSENNDSSEQTAADQTQMDTSENSDESPEGTEESEHFLSGQQRALEKAKGVEGMLQEAEAKRKKELE